MGGLPRASTRGRRSRRRWAAFARGSCEQSMMHQQWGVDLRRRHVLTALAALGVAACGSRVKLAGDGRRADLGRRDMKVGHPLGAERRPAAVLQFNSIWSDGHRLPVRAGGWRDCLAQPSATLARVYPRWNLGDRGHRWLAPAVSGRERFSRRRHNWQRPSRLGSRGRGCARCRSNAAGRGGHRVGWADGISVIVCAAAWFNPTMEPSCSCISVRAMLRARSGVWAPTAENPDGNRRPASRMAPCKEREAAAPVRSDALERLCQVGDEIAGVLDPHRVAYQRVLDADLEAFLRGELIEAHQGGLLDQALDAAK